MSHKIALPLALLVVAAIIAGGCPSGSSPADPTPSQPANSNTATTTTNNQANQTPANVTAGNSTTTNNSNSSSNGATADTGLEVIPAVKSTSSTLVRTLTSEEIVSLWLQPLSNQCTTPRAKDDPWGPPDPNVLLTEDQGNYPNYQIHSIFWRLGPELWPRNVTEATLNLYCVAHSSDNNSGSVCGYNLKQDWVLPNLAPSNWHRYCPDDYPSEYTRVVTPTNWFVSTTIGYWYQLNAAPAFRYWKSDFSSLNHFVVVIEQNSSGYWNKFASALCSDSSLRPYVEITYLPNLELKLPLPAGRAWCLTTEPGGGDCASAALDAYHTGASFWSFDFACVSTTDGKTAAPEEKVQVLAAQKGTVAKVGLADPTAGNYVVIDHGNGYTTKYLHLEDGSILVREGAAVVCGHYLGLMGNTGASTGTHLHFAINYQGDGSENIPQLKLGTSLEGWPLTKFKIRCREGQRISYYASSNQPQ